MSALISRSRFAMFGLPAVPNTAVPRARSVEAAEERGAQGVVVHQHVAVLDRELRERGLLRGPKAPNFSIAGSACLTSV